jgi:hypothetical protein
MSTVLATQNLHKGVLRDEALYAAKLQEQQALHSAQK